MCIKGKTFSCYEISEESMEKSFTFELELAKYFGNFQPQQTNV
jgi:hypothetical protein